MIEKEHIPDNAHLVRFFRENEISRLGGRVSVTVHSFNDKEMSVDWLEKTTLADGYRRKPASTGHAILSTAEVRKMGDVVTHDPTEENIAHSLVIHYGADGKSKTRPLDKCSYYLRFVALSIEQKPDGIDQQQSNDCSELSKILPSESPNIHLEGAAGE